MRGWHIRHRSALAVAVFLTVLPGAPAGQTAPSGPFAIGVLRRDGIVVPFANYDGKRWRTDWPEPREQVDVPIHVRDVPSRWWGKAGPLENWQLWLGADSAPTVHVRQPEWFAAHCYRQIGLRTDYRPAQPPPGPAERPYPKDGLAVAPPHPIQPVEIVAPAAAPPPVVAAFNEAERKAIKEFERESTWSHPYKAPQRESLPVNVEAVYAAGDPAAARVYYFEVSREYRNPNAGTSECATASYGAGWFVRDGSGPLRAIGIEAVLVDCDRYGVRYMLPLGVVHLDGRMFWIAQWSGWDYEEYDVVEIKRDKVDVAAHRWGGGC